MFWPSSLPVSSFDILSQTKSAIITTLICCNSFAQHTISGQILDQNQKPISYANIEINDKLYEADVKGEFSIPDLTNGKYTLYIYEQGYIPITKEIILSQSQNLKFILIHDHQYKLDEVEIVAHKHDFTTGNAEHIGQEYVRENFGGSLAKSLENMAGVNASGIGSSSSKPIIRGLGFNRLLVTENGIKQEGQQWGADHGLEIDALNIEDVEVIKGPSSLEYGNEAIAGVIKIKNKTKTKMNSKIKMKNKSVKIKTTTIITKIY